MNLKPYFEYKNGCCTPGYQEELGREEAGGGLHRNCRAITRREILQFHVRGSAILSREEGIHREIYW